MKARNFERLVKAYISIFLPLQTPPPHLKNSKFKNSQTERRRLSGKKYTSFENKTGFKNLNKRKIFAKSGKKRISKKCSHLKNKKGRFFIRNASLFWMGPSFRKSSPHRRKDKYHVQKWASVRKMLVFQKNTAFYEEGPLFFSNLLVFQRSHAIHAPRRYQNSFLQDNFLAPRVCFYNPARRWGTIAFF